MTVLADYLGPALSTGPDALFEAFVHWAGARGLQLYPSQEEALLAVLSGDHVVVGTPTGSGKSLVALGGHLATPAGAHGTRLPSKRWCRRSSSTCASSSAQNGWGC